MFSSSTLASSLCESACANNRVLQHAYIYHHRYAVLCCISVCTELSPNCNIKHVHSDYLHARSIALSYVSNITAMLCYAVVCALVYVYILCRYTMVHDHLYQSTLCYTVCVFAYIYMLIHTIYRYAMVHDLILSYVMLYCICLCYIYIHRYAMVHDHQCGRKKCYYLV